MVSTLKPMNLRPLDAKEYTFSLIILLYTETINNTLKFLTYIHFFNLVTDRVYLREIHSQ